MHVFDELTKLDKPMRKPFTGGTVQRAQAEPMAFPAWMRDQIIAEGFRVAGDCLVDAIATKPWYSNADVGFYPVAFLYRHYFELSMKSLLTIAIRSGVLPANIDVAAFGHNLHRLWNLTRKLIEQFNNSECADLDDLERLILAFHKIDPSNASFRYGMDTKGVEYLATEPRHVCLINLREWLAFANLMFSGLSAQLIN